MIHPSGMTAATTFLGSLPMCVQQRRAAGRSNRLQPVLTEQSVAVFQQREEHILGVFLCEVLSEL